jgi:ABC-type microcin C transport system duplicated ATPase subunit YejF
VEAAVLVPLFLSVFVVCLQLLFFSHDRVLIGAVAHEAIVMGSGRELLETQEMEAYFQRQVEGRTWLFDHIDAKVEIKNHLVKITCEAKKKGMRINIRRSSSFTEPEEQIRTLRKLEKIQEKIGDDK